jgi:hypothetical protein
LEAAALAARLQLPPLAVSTMVGWLGVFAVKAAQLPAKP